MLALPAWARPFLTVNMTVGLSVSPDYWYIVALSKEGSSGPTANLIDPNVTVSGSELSFVKDWDYLIRVKPLNDESVLQATIEKFGETEQDFATGFNEVSLSKTTRDQDTINLVVDVSALSDLNAVDQDIHVSLLTIKAPFRVDTEETSLAIDATRGSFPNYYPLSLSDQKQVLVDDPQRQETIRRSRELISEGGGNLSANIEGSTLEVLAANILTFNLQLEDR